MPRPAACVGSFPAAFNQESGDSMRGPTSLGALRTGLAARLIPGGAVVLVLGASLLSPHWLTNASLLSACGYGNVGYGGTGAPAVTNVTPNQGSTTGGTSVSITGSGFCNNTTA